MLIIRSRARAKDEDEQAPDWVRMKTGVLIEIGTEYLIGPRVSWLKANA